VKLLVDSSAFYASLDGRDANHVAANEGFVARTRSGDRLWTHNYVIAEACALVQRRLGAEAASDLLARLVPLTEILWISADVHESAVAAFLAAPSRAVSLVDRVSFEVMRRDGFDAAFAFDADFVNAGFRTIP
jgi:predicted nucleic acid-binding protein